jgi:hypothetical protein
MMLTAPLFSWIGAILPEILDLGVVMNAEVMTIGDLRPANN